MVKSIPSINKYELTDELSVVKILNDDGVLLVRNYLTTSELNNLTKEFHIALNHSENEFIKPFNYSLGKGCDIAKEKIDKKVLPMTYEVFNSSIMLQIAKEYLKGELAFNNGIYVVKDIVGSKHIANDLHFDVVRTLKFFIYLKDATFRNGAFSCIPGSQTEAQKIRRKYGDKISYENRELTRMLPYTEKDAIPVEGKAGDMIVFDTDVFHRTGTVLEGERWVMRGHTRLSSYIHKPKIITDSFSRKVINKLKSFVRK